MSSSASYRFGPFALDAASFRLTREGRPLQASPKVIDLLLYLAARPSVLVSKDELFAALWPDVAVTDNALTQAVSELRQALGDDPSKPTYIQTVARRGYRFIAPVETSAPALPSPAHADYARGDRSEAPPLLAVLDFTNMTGDPESAWLSSGIAETLTNDLRGQAAVRVIDRLRVVEAVRQCGAHLSELRRALNLDLAVVGGFQRAGRRLRITARVVDAATGEAVADAKADGEVEQVFELQDRVVARFSEALGGHGDAGGRRPQHETTSLEAYQAFTEGRVRLESLEGPQVAAAIADFERAVEFDPRYALAHVGLGNARFWQYEMSRFLNEPDAALLARAIDHVRTAIELERDLAEAHATLAFLLVSAGRAGEAIESGRRAVALEPGNWANQFRLAHAAWGSERLRALAKAVDMYPDFPFAHFEAAMVHIARGALDTAASVLREGALVQDRQAHLRQRYPARGLHWLLGLVRLAQGDAGEARTEFDREIAGGATQVYAREFIANALNGRGLIHLQSGEPREAVAMFRRALELFPDHARTLVGLAAALRAAGDDTGAQDTAARAETAMEGLRRGGRSAEAGMAEALRHAAAGEQQRAVDALRASLERSDLQFTGWTIPIEPLLEPLRPLGSFHALLDALAARAR